VTGGLALRSATNAAFAGWSAGAVSVETAKGRVGRGRAAGGYYAGKDARHFDHAQANIIRKYGENWREAYSACVHRRLRSWGLNTIANWSTDEIAYQKKTPYTRPQAGRLRLCPASRWPRA